MIRSTFMLAIAYAFLKYLSDPIVRDTADEEYDFIIVGSGPSGSAVASRLSEDPKVKVLLLEAGPSDLTQPMIYIPAKSVEIEDTELDWKYTTEQLKYSKSPYAVRMPRGKVLGGSSSIGSNVYIRGSPHDYDSWEDKGAEGWSYKGVEPFFRRVEQATMQGMSTKLGDKGQVKLTKNYAQESQIFKLFRNASAEIGINVVDYTDDMEGISHTTFSIHDGVKQNPITSYIRPIHKERKERLHVVVNSHVTKILIMPPTKKIKHSRAFGVKYLKGGKYYNAIASKEVIISAGAIATPQLLMLSGIGPKDELEKLKIQIVANLPGVGKNLQNQPAMRTFFTSNLKNPKTEAKGRDPYVEYVMDGTGPLADLPYMMMHAKSSFSGSPPSLSTKKRPCPDLQFYILELPANPRGMRFLFYVNLSHTKSRGIIKLRSKNPTDSPIIIPNYYFEEDDFLVHIDGFRLLEKFENSSAFKMFDTKMIMSSVCNGEENAEIPRSKRFYRCLIRQLVRDGHHQCCTARMGSIDDENAVVDSQLRVRGIQGLRIADASVMPHITSSNIMAPCYMIGEKAAQMIKETWKLN